MDVTVTALAAALEAFIADAADASDVRVGGLTLLPGGAVHENWGFEALVSGGPFAGRHALVLRRDSPVGLAVTLDRRAEFDLLRLAWRAEVTAPEPLWAGTGRNLADGAFFVMRRVPGSARPEDVMDATGKGGEALAAELGAALARIHRIRPLRAGADAGLPDDSPGHLAITAYRPHRERLCPDLAEAERWLERRAPDCAELTLVHRDFRIGNLMIDRARLAGVLDWAFAGWGDPMEDIGWFCAKCWRVGDDRLEAGGLAPRRGFYDGYEAAADRAIDGAAVAFWELYAHYRWAVIAHMQAERLRLGAGPVSELETAPSRAAAATAELQRSISTLVD